MILSHSPAEWSPRAGRREKARLRRELAQQLRRKDREKLAELRGAIARAKQHRRELVTGAVERCRAERVALRQRYRARKEQLLAELRAERQRERDLARGRCASRKQSARAAGGEGVTTAAKALRTERSFMREMRRTERDARARERVRVSAAERRAESDDEVRANLPPELVPVFERVRRSIKPSSRASRTEVFLRWAEEHPDEIVALEAEAADRAVAALVRERQQHERAMRKKSRYRRPELAEVPF